ncbi:hypothetical protein KXD96_11770 [Mycobacterium sp. SMC-2]|uniref:hypothetical protein n=1 Tax=Mycobacterium sp. SMC-2 TaxID=2857058 RepID=UPI0021B43161|nr:hypothetical protein [Mycobacterium sp. SMC-2]UXA08680.1 hypothetical protein KXD96_11770 [Mycobacterium sp. SMC-2]
MAAPTASDLGTFLGPMYGADLDSGQATSVLATVTAMASAYTRGVGFTNGVPNSDISAVILTASARMISHIRQTQVYEVQGPESQNIMDNKLVWSTAELSVLNRYRVMAR